MNENHGLVTIAVPTVTDADAPFDGGSVAAYAEASENEGGFVATDTADHAVER